MSESESTITDDVCIARRALDEYGLPADSALSLLNLSENATYAVTDTATGTRSILRVHRKNYHSAHEIESELNWLDSLRLDSSITVPTVLPAPDGRRVVTVDVAGRPRHIVHFEMVPGTEPDETSVTGRDFHTLGQITAALHQHSQTWVRPAEFSRFSWDWEHSLGNQPRWGRWEAAEGVGETEHAVLDRAARLLKRRLTEYGTGPEQFGLIHADLRLANLLTDGSKTTVIDFDDCGFGWFFYDFGTAVSFLEHDPALAEWQASWVDGYRSVRAMDAADEDMLASFVLLRRLLLLAWMGTHTHSKEARTKAITYAEGSCALAERYLASGGRSLF